MVNDVSAWEDNLASLFMIHGPMADDSVIFAAWIGWIRGRNAGL